MSVVCGIQLSKVVVLATDTLVASTQAGDVVPVSDSETKIHFWGNGLLAGVGLRAAVAGAALRLAESPVAGTEDIETRLAAAWQAHVEPIRAGAPREVPTRTRGSTRSEGSIRPSTDLSPSWRSTRWITTRSQDGSAGAQANAGPSAGGRSPTTLKSSPAPSNGSITRLRSSTASTQAFWRGASTVWSTMRRRSLASTTTKRTSSSSPRDFAGNRSVP